MGRFFLIWSTITTLCWVLLGALFAPRMPGGGLTVLVCALLLASPMLLLARGFLRASYPGRATRLLVMRPFWYGQLVLPFTAIAALLGVVVGAGVGLVNGHAAPTAAAGGRIAALALLGLALVVFVAGYAGSRRLVVRRFTARLPTLPEAFEGLRLVQLTDLHVGPHTPPSHLSAIASAVREARPDVVALTGDLVDDYARDVEPFEQGLGRLSANDGVFAIAGNHDVYAGWDAVRAGFEAQGITVLVNDAVALRRGDARVALAGTGDPAGRMFHRRGGEHAAPDVPATVARARTLVGTSGCVIALAHNPALWPELKRMGVDLTLSGHTHWGQFAIPSLRWCLASPFLRHAMGAYVENGCLLYVHPGTNYWGLPFRIGTPPEVAVITLARGAAAFESVV